MTNKEDDLIIKLLANKENWHKITLELANTEPEKIDQLDKAIMQRERWN